MHGANSSGAFRQGVVILVVLAALTGVEYASAVLAPDLWTVLVVLALIKAGIVLQYFMHLPRVLASDDEGGH